MDNNTISKLAGIAAEFAALVRVLVEITGRKDSDLVECYELAIDAEEALRKIKTDEETKKMDDRRQDAKHWTIGEKELNRANLDRLYTNMVAERKLCMEKMDLSEGTEWYTNGIRTEIITKLLKESGIEP